MGDTLIERVEKYYLENEFGDGRGKRLTLNSAKAITDDGGVIMIRDSLGEIDIIFDPAVYEVSKSAPDYFKLGAQHVGDLEDAKKYGISGIAESSWFPLHMRRSSTWEDAKAVASAFMVRKD